MENTKIIKKGLIVAKSKEGDDETIPFDNNFLFDCKLGTGERGLLITIMYQSHFKEVFKSELYSMSSDNHNEINDIITNLKAIGYLREEESVNQEGQIVNKVIVTGTKGIFE